MLPVTYTHAHCLVRYGSSTHAARDRICVRATDPGNAAFPGIIDLAIVPIPAGPKPRTPPITSVRVGAANRTNPAVVVELAILLLEWVRPDYKSLIVFNHILLAPIWILERI